MKSILILLILFAVGCTPLVVKEPIGKNYSPEQLNEFEGRWVLEQEGEKPVIIQLKRMDLQGHFRTAYIEWDEEKQGFQLNEDEIILKMGNEYGILHLINEDQEDNSEGLLLITLFKITEKGKIEYLITKSDETKKLLNSGILKTESIDGDLVITDDSETIIHVLESQAGIIFDPKALTTATKLVEQE